ncbi:MAG TPA: hypothetical protein VHZ24_20465 [Pirellulales bacterium]|jgi:hypothetical protein|nr:hypothetical protein [Pirellulales bacterium]
MPRLFKCVVVVVLAIFGIRTSAAEPATSTATSPYLDVVRRTVDALLRTAVDRFGKQQSGMILSVLDRENATPLTKLPSPPAGVRQGDRCGPGGSNANLQQDLYRSMFHLSRLTGDPQYAEAARDALLDFLRIAQSPETGLLAWGEHMFWDCVDDCPGTLYGKQIHEPKRKILYFDLWYDADPERTLRYARGLWDHQIFDHKTGNFSRHASYDKHDPRKDFDFAKEGSYFIDCWSKAYEKSRDPVYQEAVRVLTTRYLGRANPKTRLLDCDSSKDPARVNLCVALWSISLAMESAPAAKRMDAETSKLLEQLATEQDDAFLALPHDFSSPDRGFICYCFADTGKARERAEKKSNGYSRHWSMGYGINPTSMFALLSNTRQAQLGNDPRAEKYRKLVVEGADVYRRETPNPKNDDLWAGEYGMAIFTELAAYRLTKRTEYLEAAQRLADESIAVFWDRGAPLPRASSKTKYYDCISYPDTLLLSLLALHEAVAGLTPRVEISDLNR